MVTVGCDRASSLEALGRRRPAHPSVHATVGLHPHEAQHGVDTIADLFDGDGAAGRRRGVRARLPLRPLAARRPARRRSPPRSARPPARPAARHPHPRGVGRHVRHPRRRGRAGAHDLPLLHRRARRGPTVPRPRRLRQLLRHRHVPRRAGRPRRGRRSCPLDRTLVETDSPYLAPVPNRGKRNRPAWVPLVGACLAEVHGVAVEDGPRRHASRRRDRLRPRPTVPTASARPVCVRRSEFLAFSSFTRVGARCPAA